MATHVPQLTNIKQELAKQMENPELALKAECRNFGMSISPFSIGFGVRSSECNRDSTQSLRCDSESPADLPLTRPPRPMTFAGKWG